MKTDTELFAGLTPLIEVFDMPEALAFYRNLLGFQVIFASPEVDAPEGRFSHFMSLRLGAATVMLNTRYDSGERTSARDNMERGACLYIHSADIDAAYEQLRSKGFRVEPPKAAPYWLRGFSGKDPDGNIVVFQELAPGA